MRFHPKAPKPRWILAPQPDAAAISRIPDVPPQVAMLLWQRGFRDPASARAFLFPRFSERADPGNLSDMEKAVMRLKHARDKQEKCFVVGDGDHDGISGAVILGNFFEDLGLSCEICIPSEQEGHAVPERAIQDAKKIGTRLFITVDFGIKEYATFAKVKKEGMDGVILDHHVLPPVLPEVYAAVDPHRDPNVQQLRNLCGAGVAFAFVDACLRDGIVPNGVSDPEAYLRSFLDLVAIATIGDLVELSGDNRAFVFEGLSVLGERKRPGIAALLDVSRLPRTISSEDVMFSLVPRINAPGRMNRGNLAFELLKEKTPEKAATLAQDINRSNRDRQKVMKKMQEEALAKVETLSEIPWVIVLGEADWQLSFSGLVASRLVERYARPAFVWTKVSDDIVRMSGRAMSSFNLVDAMEACGGEDLFIKFGGHAQAAGCDLLASRFSEFERRIQEYGKKVLNSETLTPEITIDLEVGIQELGPQFAGVIEKLSPFGKGNPRPRFLVRNAKIEMMRRSSSGVLVRMVLRPGISVFITSDHPAARLRAGDTIDMVVQYGRFMGMPASRTPVLLLQDAHLSES